jgi:shikimate kinase
MSNAPSNIVLSGFMGTGKSTVGRLAAEQLGLTFVDTDPVIEAQAGRSIAEIFAQEGEAGFRQREAEVCLVLAEKSGQVVAAGGGALLNTQVYEAFAAHSLLIGLTCDLEEIIRRIGDAPTRPLYVADRERLGRLLESRAEHYNRLPYHIDTTCLNPQQVAQEVIQLWHQHN